MILDLKDIYKEYQQGKMSAVSYTHLAALMKRDLKKRDISAASLSLQ